MRNIFAFTTCVAVVVLTTNVSRLHAEVRTQRIVSGLDQPLFVTSAPDLAEADRLFILEKGGLIKVFDQGSGSLLSTPFLDLTGQVSTVNEQGLLGLAFHPDYATNGQFYVNYTDSSGNLQVSQYEVSANPNVADAATSQSVINIPQSSPSHNGGWLGFRRDEMSDGLLYIAVGDDRIGYEEIEVGDPPTTEVTLQNRKSLNGAILRIDVDGDDDFPADVINNYAIPDTNPITEMDALDGERREIWSYGLRNPWRPSFDSEHGDLYIGDVGENSREEINFQFADDGMGAAVAINYAWPHREGRGANPDAIDGSSPVPSVGPILDYAHGDGQFQGHSVTGGYVYRGSDESTQGQYFYSDFVTGRIYSIELDRDAPTLQNGSETDWTGYLAPLSGSIDSVSSFGEDAAGNLFMVDFDGEIYRVDPVEEMVTTAAFVDSLYDRVLVREGDTTGRAYWNAQLTGDEMIGPAMTREQVAAEFWQSEENVRQRVNKLYNEILRRPADAIGREHHTDQILNNGMTDADIAVAMLTSFEFHRDHLSDLAFIDAVFDRTLGRDPNSSELSNLFLALQGGAERANVARSVVESMDNIDNVVDDQYESLLGRTADSGGKDFFSDQLFFDFMTADEMAVALTSSQEFVYGALRDANFGDDMFFAASASSAPFSLAALQSIPAASQGVHGAAAAIPEPTSWALISLGLACLAARSRRRRR